jgi:hypothetical protein
LINLKQQYHETDEAETTVDSQTNLTEWVWMIIIFKFETYKWDL